MPDAESHLTIALVPAADIDFESVATLVNSAFARHTIRSGPRTSPAGLVDEAGGDGQFLLARKGTRLVGSALVRPATSVFRAATLTELNLANALYFGLAAVADGETNQGIGARLLAVAEACARARGHNRVVLGTLREFGLVDYYGRRGYDVVHFRDYPAGHWALSAPHRFCTMAKLLPPE